MKKKNITQGYEAFERIWFREIRCKNSLTFSQLQSLIAYALKCIRTQYGSKVLGQYNIGYSIIEGPMRKWAKFNFSFLSYKLGAISQVMHLRTNLHVLRLVLIRHCKAQIKRLLLEFTFNVESKNIFFRKLLRVDLAHPVLGPKLSSRKYEVG